MYLICDAQRIMLQNAVSLSGTYTMLVSHWPNLSATRESTRMWKFGEIAESEWKIIEYEFSKKIIGMKFTLCHRFAFIHSFNPINTIV